MHYNSCMQNSGVVFLSTKEQMGISVRSTDIGLPINIRVRVNDVASTTYVACAPSLPCLEALATVRL